MDLQTEPRETGAPPGPGPEQPERPRRIRPWLLVTLLLLLGAGLAASLVRIPYYALAPGSALEVAGLVEVREGPSYEADGSVYLTTVSFHQVTPFEALRGWLDPDIDVVEEDTVVPPDTDPEELREINLDLMEQSKEAALGVAFEELGFDAISGSGASVVRLVRDAPADGRLREGDTIVALDGEPVRVDGDVIGLLDDRSPGQRVRVTVERGGGRRRIGIRLGERPGVAGQPFLGVSLATRDLELDFPYDVDIQSERIGGPSAGLAFTLEVLDVLTPGELTGGREVAATGTIELDGSVGDVGGVPQKTVAVQEAGITLFLVPRAELAAAREAAEAGLQVEPVDTLEDALEVLAAAGGDELVR